MWENNKITLYPTRYIKKISPEAIGTAQFSDDGSSISLNLFNLPILELDTRQDFAGKYYCGWLYNPNSEQALSVGTLAPSGDGLYILYDIPLKIAEGYSELIITCEKDLFTYPRGEILLIGYLAQPSTQRLESFEPFSPLLPFHRWWKMEANSSSNSSVDQCQFCPYWQRFCWPSEKQHDQFDLPQIIGILHDEHDTVRYLVHGIPGRLSKQGQPERGRTGYLYWHPYYGMKEKPGAMGYWLCYIDPGTNKIMTPLGVTIPKV